MKTANIFTLIVSLALLIVITGCGAPNDIDAFIKPYQRDVTSSRYILMPPDEIEVHCTKVPEIDLEYQQIRPDGKVSFEAIGEIEAAGKTPDEVAALIAEKVAKLYNLPGDDPIDVRVTKFKSKVFYMMGEVLSPGPKEYTGRISAVTAINMSGLKPTTWREQMRVIRPSRQKNTAAQTFVLNWKKVQKGDLTRDVLLQEGDIVYLPPTPLAAVGNLFAEFAYPIGQALSPVTSIQNVNSGPRGGRR